ncbi:MAG: M23 family metallopeptidase [Proteobacteria bacterium]|nr:M23 family metallopeptidase [Pseudomonadota bacterium]
MAATSGDPAVAAASDGPRLTPLLARVLAAPQPVRGSDGQTHLLYELEIENVTSGRATLEEITVTDAAGAVLGRFDARALAARVSLGGRRGSETAVLESSQFAVAFLHVVLPPKAEVPARLEHRVRALAEKVGADLTMTLAPTEVVGSAPALLAPPLRGSGYVVGDGCCDSIRHVRALLSLDGRFFLAQRFAIDFEQVGSDHRIVSGDPKLVTNYKIYNAPVYAVAAGTVVSARNDLDNQVPGHLPEGLPLDQADGNFVILDLGGGRFALYAHMIKGSVTVAAGARVQPGQQIGRVGNSGNTQAPHLHFQLMDGPSALAANGLPYLFRSYTVTAEDRAGTADFDRAEATGAPMTLTPIEPAYVGHATLPLDLSVVSFAD